MACGLCNRVGSNIIDTNTFHRISMGITRINKQMLCIMQPWNAFHNYNESMNRVYKGKC